MDAFANFAQANVIEACDASDTSLTLEIGGAARFPACPFNAVWWNGSAYPSPFDDPDREIVRVTAFDGDECTVIRAQEGTVATAKNTPEAQYRLLATLTAIAMNELALSSTATYAGDPNSHLDGNVGRLCYDPGEATEETRHLWVKETTSGTLTGWAQLF